MEDFAATAAPVMDAPEVATAPVETPAPETPETPTPDAPETPEGQQQPAQPGQPLVENGRLAAEAKATLDKMATENPAMAKRFKDALFEQARLRQELPGGFKELASLRDTVEQFGGPNGLAEVKTELDGWHEFDQQWTAGDPKVLEFLLAEPQGQVAFAKIAPMAFDKLAETHPDVWTNYVARQFAADMNASELKLDLIMLQRSTANNPEVKEFVDKIVGYYNKIQGLAAKTPAAPASQGQQKPDERAAQLEQREKEFTRKEWGTETLAKHTELYQANWKTLIGDRKLTDLQRENIGILYERELQRLLPADFKEKLERYFASGQKEGFTRTFESVYRDAVPKALRAAINRTLPSKPGPTAGTPATPKPGQPAPKPQAGVTMVNTKPNMATEVDRVRTTPEMWASKRAVLRTGKVVSWV